MYKALTACETVITAWDGEKLVGLINAIDDGGMTAYVHYLLVLPEYQSRGVGRTLTEMTREKYKDFFYFFLVAEHKPLVNYYKNRTPFSKSKIWTAVRTLKYMFAAFAAVSFADFMRALPS